MKVRVITSPSVLSFTQVIELDEINEQEWKELSLSEQQEIIQDKIDERINIHEIVGMRHYCVVK